MLIVEASLYQHSVKIVVQAGTPDGIVGTPGTVSFGQGLLASMKLMLSTLDKRV